MPIEIFRWAKNPDPEFSSVAAAGIIVLLGILLIVNGVALYVRHRAGRRLNW
jgi:phosphate transport system permease protein